MNACEDFFELITKAHVVVTYMKAFFKMSALSDQPDEESFPCEKEKAVVLHDAVEQFLSDFVDLSFPVKGKKSSPSLDHVREYGKDVLTLLLLLESEQVMGRGSLDVGNLCSFFSEQRVIQIMLWKHFDYFANIITYCHHDMLSS